MRNCRLIWSPLSIFAPEGHLDSVLVPRSLVKGLARLERGAVEMQAGCALCVADILHTVQANGVIYVSTLVLLENSLRSLLHVSVRFAFGPIEQRLLQLALQQLHETVGVCVVVNTTAVAFSPAQDHEIELAVSLINQVPCVPVLIELCIFHPLLRFALV